MLEEPPAPFQGSPLFSRGGSRFLVCVKQSFRGVYCLRLQENQLYSEYKERRVLQNTGTHLPNYTASHPTLMLTIRTSNLPHYNPLNGQATGIHQLVKLLWELQKEYHCHKYLHNLD
jgi:hypothetical protein